MKNNSIALLTFCALLATACGVSSQKGVDSYIPEETGLNVQKLSDESKSSVLTNARTAISSNFAATSIGGNRKNGITWSTNRWLAISPEGDWLAYGSRINKQNNIMIRRSNSTGTSTQRTFRNVSGFCWGTDENLYFSDNVGNNTYQIASVGAKSGSLMKQVTSNSHDTQPILSQDGKLLFFVRFDNVGPSVWTLDFETNTLTSCSRGYNPCPVGDGREEFICVRNSSEGRSELWLVNYINGQETLLLSEKERGFSNPCLSPDGKWIVCQGNAKSAVNKKQNLDIFVIKIDGSNFMQLTYHPSDDSCPVWAADGKSIYFISSRGTKDAANNIWKMNFNL